MERDTLAAQMRLTLDCLNVETAAINGNLLSTEARKAVCNALAMLQEFKIVAELYLRSMESNT